MCWLDACRVLFGACQDDCLIMFANVLGVWPFVLSAAQVGGAQCPLHFHRAWTACWFGRQNACPLHFQSPKNKDDQLPPIQALLKGYDSMRRSPWNDTHPNFDIRPFHLPKLHVAESGGTCFGTVHWHHWWQVWLAGTSFAFAVVKPQFAVLFLEDAMLIHFCLLPPGGPWNILKPDLKPHGFMAVSCCFNEVIINLFVAIMGVASLTMGLPSWPAQGLCSHLGPKNVDPRWLDMAGYGCYQDASGCCKMFCKDTFRPSGWISWRTVKAFTHFPASMYGWCCSRSKHNSVVWQNQLDTVGQACESNHAREMWMWRAAA